MGATSKYGLPWPASTAFLKDGATAIKALADKLEAELLPPLLSTNSNGAPDWGADKTGRVPWDVSDNPDKKRGSWGGNGSADRNIVPPTDGWYLVTASYGFAAKAEADWASLKVQTQVPGDASTKFTWARSRIDIPATADLTQLSVSSMVQISGGKGIQIEVEYGGTSTRPTTPDSMNRINIYRLSR